MSNVMMKCGHTAQAKRTSDAADYCLICDCAEPETNEPDLSARRARCSYFGRTTNAKRWRGDCPNADRQPDDICRCEKPSATSLAFFTYCGPGTKHYAGEKPHDEFYCGCLGWD